jgi:hypothetical protein
MKYMELHYKMPLQDFLFTGTIDEAEAKFKKDGVPLDRNTIYKWRVLVRAAIDKQFWKEFPKQSPPID